MERIFVFSLGRQTQPLILQRAAGRLAWWGWGGKGVGVGLGRRKCRFSWVGGVREVLGCGQISVLSVDVDYWEGVHAYGVDEVSKPSITLNNPTQEATCSTKASG